MEITWAKKRADNDRYVIYDDKCFGLVVSTTILKASESTTGHKHPHEEHYMFVCGKGVLEFGAVKSDIEPGDTITIKGDTFHRVYNTSASPLIFVCMWREKNEV